MFNTTIGSHFEKTNMLWVFRTELDRMKKQVYLLCALPGQQANDSLDMELVLISVPCFGGSTSLKKIKGNILT